MRYTIRQKVFSFSDSFTVKDELENPLLKVEGKIFSLGDKLRIYDMNNNEIYYIEQEIFRLLPEYRIYEKGKEIAFFKKEFTFLKPKINIESIFGEYTVTGSVFGYNFSILKNNKTIARIEKALFAFSDTYSLEIVENEDMKFMVTMAIVIDQMIHDSRSTNNSRT